VLRRAACAWGILSAIMTTKRRIAAFFACLCLAAAAACSSPASSGEAPGADPALAAFIAGIRAVDNHTHANSVAPGDADADALPLDGIAPFELPMLAHADNPAWLAAYKALYKYPYDDLSDAHMVELRKTMQDVARAQGEKFPEWVLDQTGTEVLLANRLAMGPGLAPPRVRWVSYVDALMYPLSTQGEAATSPDRRKLFPLVDALLKRALSDLKMTALPSTLEAYLQTVVTATLESQQRAGCLAVKFEAAYLRALDFGNPPAEAASRVYARYVRGGEPLRDEYKTLQDFLFRYIAREAGRLGMAVHIHSFEGAGNAFRAAGADPLLLEPAVTDPSLQKTNFVIVHGGGVFASHAGALLWKPNVHVDTSLMALVYPPARLAAVLRDWLGQFPERVLFGTDAVALGPDTGWEVAAWAGGTNVRRALAVALSGMVRDGEITRGRAEEIATMVMRTNAGKLYRLELR
jgi:hypothetical protein